ncbi:hypothetical protein [Actinoplanes palleronii]|nr:hypothetical protein [Actinoplanes palleronii]
MRGTRERDPAAWMTGLLVGGGVGGAVLSLLALRDLFSFADTEPAHPVRGGWFLLACAVLLVAAPLTATGIGVRHQRKIYATVCAVLSLAGLVAGGLIALSGLRETGLVEKPAPVVATTPARHCVELSGGDTRCPGG